MPPPLSLPGVPPAVTEALEKLRAELTAAAGDDLAALVLYGGLVRGRYQPGRSDVNLAVVLRRASGGTLAAMAAPLHAAWRALRVEPFLLTLDELPRVAAVFPTKILDIKDSHVVLSGADPFAGIEVQREQLRLRVEQELRNQTIRLRRRFLAAATSPRELTAILADVARPLAVQLAALLRLTDRPVPDERHTAPLLDAAAVAFGLDREALRQLAQMRQEPAAAGDAAGLYGRVLETVAKAADLVGELKEPRA
jgi:hypothetical protein